MREETKAAIRLEVKRWFLCQARAMVWRADEWIHKQELTLRDFHGVGRDTPLQRAKARKCPTVTDETAPEKPEVQTPWNDFNPFPQMALLADGIGAETDSQQSAGQRQLRANAGCAAKQARTPAGPSWAQIKQENSRRRDSHRRPLWMVR